ncbi:uncharacterized protein JCM10292_004281 [Rhodotorula paludigena]|uniref:uncharacterized protein n=1 Tax=Rhodotorula paludigena TaxID=86838 RepID=UPI00316F31E8
MASTTSTSTFDSIKNTVSDAVNYVTESAQEMTSASSKEANKEVAKGNTDASLTDRATAGLDAVGDKLQEEKHSIDSSGKAEAYKESAKN